MKELHEHLGVRSWPFSVVPRPDHCTFIAGRSKLKGEIDELIDALSRRDTSSVHVLWSWYGAGKTHALYYLQNEAQRRLSRPVKLVPVYTEFPKGARGFVDLYRAFMASLDINILLNAFLEFQTSVASDQFYERLRVQEPDLATALRLLAMGDSSRQMVALRWLRGDQLAASELRPVGISQRISGTQQTTRIVSIMIRLLADAAAVEHFHSSRLIWMLDEFQRAKKAGVAVLNDVNAGLHSLFNGAPVGFSLVLSFSGSPAARSLPDWFSPELRDRIGMTRVFVLPPLQPSDALCFVRDVLHHYRLQDGCKRDEFFPFDAEACRAILAHVEGKGELRPRAIMNAFNAVLEAADPEIEAGKLPVIDTTFAARALAEYIDVSPQEDE